LAVRAREIVTVAKRPSGTLATIIPIANTKQRMIGYDHAIPRTKKITPSVIAIAEIILINQWISLFKGVCSVFAL